MLPKSDSGFGAVKGVLASAMVACTAACPALGAEIAAVGAVEAIDCSSQTIRVLGITFKAANSVEAAAICSYGQPQELLYVAISGKSLDDSSIRVEKSSLLSKGAYVPGATPVYIRGQITKQSSLVGELTVNGAIVSGLQNSQVLGHEVEIVGTQPVLGGLVLADSSSGSGIQSSSGSGKLSSSGSGILSSSGSGRLSSSGSGRLSSSGSGIMSSSGSGKLSSSGSGILSSSGSGIMSSSGSGKLSSSGSGILSSSGSGIMSSSGSGILSSSGSGTLSSSGSGRLSSSGSGLASN
jgi:hypothetical protein